MSDMNNDSSVNANRLMMTAAPASGSDEIELSLAGVLRTILKHRIMIICTVLLVFGVVAIYTYLKTPIYESVARIEIDPSRSSNLGLEDLVSEKLGTGESGSRVATEVKVI